MERSDAPLRLKADVRFRDVVGEGVVQRQADGEVLVVNGVGLRVLELLQKGASVDQMFRTLEQEYEVTPEELRADVKRYLVELEQAGVLEAER